LSKAQTKAISIILVPDKNKFPGAYVKKFVKEAYAKSLAKADHERANHSQICFSEKKREKDQTCKDKKEMNF
jgi:hypothetical protein